MWIFDPKCDNDDETEYIGCGAGIAKGSGIDYYDD